MDKHKFCKMVKASIKDEKGADAFYTKLKKVSPKDAIQLINQIRNDERNHRKVFERFKKQYC